MRRIEVGHDSFMYVQEVKMIGLSELKSVEIGMNSFTQHKTDYGYDPNRHFYLKNCSRLRELRVRDYSFSDYTVIEIENVDALEVIEVGIRVFNYASLELKSILIHNE